MENIPAGQTASIYIQFTTCGQHVRKWSREPFEGGVCFARVEQEIVG